MELVNFSKNVTASASNAATATQNKPQKEVNLFIASNKSELNFSSKSELNFFEGMELLVENSAESVDDAFSNKINEPDLKFSKPEPKFNLDNAYLEIDNSELGLSAFDFKA